MIMCEVIQIGDCTAIICGGQKDHICDEKASVYETKDGKRHYFKDSDEAARWYDKNYMHTIMGGVACSICEGALIDKACWV